MKRVAVSSILVAVVMIAVAVIAEAQQPKKVPRIGFLQPGVSSQLIEKNSGKVCASSVT